MRAAVGNETDVSLLVAEQHQVFAQDPYKLSGLLIGQLAGYGYRMPITPEQLPCRRSGPNAGDPLVLFLGQHGILFLRINKVA